jgi:hypothetical protein
MLALAGMMVFPHQQGMCNLHEREQDVRQRRVWQPWLRPAQRKDALPGSQLSTW